VGPIYLANGPRLRGRLPGVVDAADPAPRLVVMDLGAVPDIDVTAQDILAGLDAATAFAASHSSSTGDDRPAGPPPP
jgi:hypothetical protein